MAKAETTMKVLEEIHKYITNAIADFEKKFTSIVSKDAVILGQYIVKATDATEIDQINDISPDDANAILQQLMKSWTQVSNQTHNQHIKKNTNETSVQVETKSCEVSTQTGSCDSTVHVTTQTGVEECNSDTYTDEHLSANENNKHVHSEEIEIFLESQKQPTHEVIMHSGPDRDTVNTDMIYNIFKEDLSFDELLDQAIYEPSNETSRKKEYSDKYPIVNEMQINPHSENTGVSKQSEKRVIVDEILDKSTLEEVRVVTLQEAHESFQQLYNDELKKDEIQEPGDTLEELIPQNRITTVGEDLNEVSQSRGVYSKHNNKVTDQGEQNNAISSFYQETPTDEAIPYQTRVTQSTAGHIQEPDTRKLVICKYLKKAPQCAEATTQIASSNSKKIDSENQTLRGKEVAELKRDKSVTGHFSKNASTKSLSRRERVVAKKKEKAARRKADKKGPTFNEKLMGALKLENPTAKAARLIQKGKCPMNLLELIGKGVSFKESHAQFICINLLDITNYLHSNGVIHKNISPKSVVLDDKGYPCLTGFEKSEISGLYVSGRHLGIKTDIEYTSPEQVLKGPVTGATDAFSIGVLVYSMIYGRSPHHDSEYKKTRENILNENFIPNFEPDRLLTKVAKRFLVSCIRKDTNKRFSLNKTETMPLASVEWFKDFDFPAFRKKKYTSPFMEFINKEVKYNQINCIF